MIEGPELRRLCFTDTHGLGFAYFLRNENAALFFHNKKVSWKEHLQWFRGRSRDPQFEFFIIWWHGQRVGTIGVEHRKDCEFLQNLCIVGSARGNGLARWAITQLMLPHRFIVAQVKPSNRSVIKMYQELGFWKVLK